MANAASGDGDSDRSTTVVGETPLAALIRMGAPSRRVERAYAETRNAIDHSRDTARSFIEAWRASATDATSVEAAQDAGDFLAELEAELSDQVQIAVPNQSESLQILFGYLIPATALNELADALQDRAERIASPTVSVDDIADLYRTVRRNFSTWRNKYYPAALDQLTDIQPSGYQVHAGSITTRLLSDRQVQRIAFSVKAAESAAAEAKQATGRTGQDVIGTTFDNAAKDEANKAQRWTWAVFALVLVGAAGTLTFVTIENDVLAAISAGWALIFKALIGLPFYGLAAYCAHVAGEHRSLARHFRILRVQLQSIGAYVTPMSDEQTSELRMILGRQAFSTPVPGHQDNAGITLGADQLLSLLGRFGDKG